MSNAEKNKKNYSDDVICVSHMTKWWIKVRSIMLKTMLKVFDSTKKSEVKTTEAN